MVIFHSYVKLPEGKGINIHQPASLGYNPGIRVLTCFDPQPDAHTWIGWDDLFEVSKCWVSQSSHTEDGQTLSRFFSIKIMVKPMN